MEICYPWRELSKNVWHGTITPKERPQMPNLLRLGVILVHLHFLPSFFPPHFIPYLSPVPFSHREVNKKFSYRGQNALTVIKTHEPNNDSASDSVFGASDSVFFWRCAPYKLLYYYSEHIRTPWQLYTGRKHNALDLSVRLSVCPFVRSFVCYQRVNAVLRKWLNRFQCKLA